MSEEQPKTIWQFIKDIPAARAFHVGLVAVAVGLYWKSHNKLPSLEELGVATLLLTTRLERLGAIVGIGKAKTDPPVIPPATPVAVLAIFLAFGASCATVPAPVAVVGNCAVEAVHISALNVLSSVQTALATGDWKSALTNLATRFGIDAVSCAVQEVASTTRSNWAMSADQLEGVKAERAQEWLNEHPVKPL